MLHNRQTRLPANPISRVSTERPQFVSIPVAIVGPMAPWQQALYAWARHEAEAKLQLIRFNRLAYHVVSLN